MPGRPPSPTTRRRRALVAAAVVVVLVATGIVVGRLDAPQAAPAARPVSAFVEVPEAPGSADRIRIDTDLYLPATRPAPAVLLAHGFGQDKRDLATEAKRLQGEGFVVLAYSARGFGESGGKVDLDALQGSVADAKALVDVLARRPEVERIGPAPMIGVVGASYGGALALMLGATDHRIGAVVAGITWNDLAQALDPESAGTVDRTARARLFKTGWASRLFGTGSAGSGDPCSRFTAQLCDLYGRLTAGGDLSARDLALLQNSSPSSVVWGMRAPVLLLQGEEDSLFGLDQADANRNEIRFGGGTARVRWYDGGHDGDGTVDTDQAVDDWLAARLKEHTAPARRFTYDVPAGATSFLEHHALGSYPGLDGRGSSLVDLAGGAQTIVNPPGGQPTSVTSLPGIGADTDVGRAAGGLLGQRNPKDQLARFTSAAMTDAVVLGGRVHLRVRVDSSAGGDVVLFGQLTALTGSIRRMLPGGVTPIRVMLPPGGGTIDVAMNPTVWRFAPGDRIELSLRTTDAQYLGSTTAAAYRVSVDGPIRVAELPTPAVAAVSIPGRAVLGRIGLLLALLALLVLAAVVAGRVRRHGALAEERRAAGGPDRPAAPPLAVRAVTKRFASGFVAVDDVSFTVERGQVLGLLGENGAGKTTTMRMALGLTRPDAGAVECFGVPVRPGAPVLRRVGAFVEGPGFLPHLSGRRNLRLHWAATGRPRREARFDEVLAIADLGRAVRRRVGGYSQGMRQRLAIAQAMLGMPDLLVLDEPTNGLDPPQIAALRGVLRRYAEGGRTVVVSSHLLGEVERTCSHVVVMSRGRVVAAGPVAEVAGEADDLVLEVDEPDRAVEVLGRAGLRAQPGIGTVRVRPDGAALGGVVALLAGAGVVVTDVRRERHLEDAFLELIGSTQPR